MFSPLKLAVKKVVILPWVGEKEGSFKSARGGVGQGGHHGDRPRGHSMLLLHLPVVPKIEKADVSLSGSGFFLCVCAQLCWMHVHVLIPVYSHDAVLTLVRDYSTPF